MWEQKDALENLNTLENIKKNFLTVILPKEFEKFWTL